MSDSIWTATLAAFRDRLASDEPVPAGVTAAAVSATLALALLAKVLQVTRNRKDFAGDRKLVAGLLRDARGNFRTLSKLADQDIAAFRQYLNCLRLPKSTAAERERSARLKHDALRKAIEVPLNVARTAAAGIALCETATSHVHAVVAPDLGTAAGLLAGALRSTLLSVNSNLQQLPQDDPYRMQVAAEARSMEKC